MNATQSDIANRLRIIWAIAAKDIVDALRNRTTIGVVLGVAMLMLSGQALPLITRLSTAHQLVIYDAGNSRLIPALQRNPDLRLLRASSQQELEKILGESSGNMLGLIIPVDFDQALDAGHPSQLEAFFAHWVGEADAAQQQAFFQARLTDLAGQPVRIHIKGHPVYPTPDSDGQPFMASISLVVAIITISGVLVPFLMLEEKETKTIDALLVSPASIGQVTIGKAIAGMVYGLAAAAVVFAFNRGLMVHWGWAILAAICGTLFAVAVGLLLGSVFDNPQNMGLWLGALFAILLLPAMLSTTTLSLPAFLKTVVPWIPSTALTKAFRISFSGRVALDQILSQLGLVVGVAGLLLAAVVWVVRRSDR
jgi:ABC-2 type transport system permease protein